MQIFEFFGCIFVKMRILKGIPQAFWAQIQNSSVSSFSYDKNLKFDTPFGQSIINRKKVYF